MDKFIEVYDEFSKDLSDSLENYILNSQKIDWKLIRNISGVKGQEVPGFANIFYSQTIPDLFDQDIAFPFLQPLYTLCASKNILLLNIIHARLFLQSPSITPGPHKGAIHTDLPGIDHWVCLYYVNDSEGDTIFFDDNNNEIKRISPKKGRIAFFDGSIKHTGSSSSSMRAVINICFSGHKLG
jgi:hypothetical protein